MCELSVQVAWAFVNVHLLYVECPNMSTVDVCNYFCTKLNFFVAICVCDTLCVIMCLFLLYLHLFCI